MNKYAEYIMNTLTARELLEQLAEECNELSKASLKLIRALGLSENATPTRRQVRLRRMITSWKNRKMLSRCCGY